MPPAGLGVPMTMDERWVIRGVAKIHLFKRAQHSPGGLLPPLRTPHKSTTPTECLEKNKNFDPQPPGPHVAHADSGVAGMELER